jgi:hypothetical protein
MSAVVSVPGSGPSATRAAIAWAIGPSSTARGPSAAIRRRVAA